MLKKMTVVFLILFSMIILCHDVNAVPEPKNEITINPFGLFWGSFNIEFEKGGVLFLLVDIHLVAFILIGVLRILWNSFLVS